MTVFGAALDQCFMDAAAAAAAHVRCQGLRLQLKPDIAAPGFRLYQTLY
jgi:hypothetical protein